MSKYRPGKLYGFGVSLKEKGFYETIEQMLSDSVFLSWIKERDVNEIEVQYIRQGFLGEKFCYPSLEDAIDDNEIIPFGKFKGKRLTEVPEKYIHWLFQKDWLPKFPSLYLAVKNHIDKMNEGAASMEDIKQILKPL